MFAELTAWWLSQMRSLAPGLWRGFAQRDALIITIDSMGQDDATAAGAIVLRRDGVEISLQPLDLAHPFSGLTAAQLDTCLRLPPGAVLSRDVQLPIEAARDLQAVIGFEMDRLTPFAADEVYWSAADITQDRARGRITLRLSIVLRAPVEALNRALARIGLAPSYIESGMDRIDLDTAHPRQRLIRRGLFPALCGGLALACVAIPFIRQQMALDTAARTIASYRSTTDTAQALRRQLATAAAGHSAIAAARRAGDALQVLATLTSALPDGTWLSDLTFKSGDLSFDGQSTGAAQLIGLLSTVPGLHDPSFTAPVTRTADGKADVFSMHVSVGP
jgi:general secretion pathway protein L